MTPVLLDTNFTLLPFTVGVDVRAEIERVIPDAIILVCEDSRRELEGLQTSPTISGADKRAAKAALTWIQQFTLIPSHSATQTHVDALIIEYCMNNPQTVVATQDKALKKRLQPCAKGVIVLRSRSHVELQVH